MTRAQLLAIAATLTALTSGLYFLSASDGTVAPLQLIPMEVFNTASCAESACVAAQCLAANSVLADAGSPCVIVTRDCAVRVRQPGVDIAADAGLALHVGYNQVAAKMMKCPADAGGFSYGLAVNDAGQPMFASVLGSRGCVKRDAGVPLAQCSLPDGGDPGQDNQFQAGQLVGAGCSPCVCGVVAGDSPE